MSEVGRFVQPSFRAPRLSRRGMLATTAGIGGLGLADFLHLRSCSASPSVSAPHKAKRCIIIFCWGGMSHIDTWDPKPNASLEIRGEFNPISTVVPGIQISEHMPLLARQTDKLAIIRSINHDDSAHGRGMYWNLTGHRPPRAGNIPPMPDDWPTLSAMISQFRFAPRGVPAAVTVPYPMWDNDTLQAGEYAGWLGVKHNAIVMRPRSGVPYVEAGKPGVSSAPLDLKDIDEGRLIVRSQLLGSLENPLSQPRDFESFAHYRDMAQEILLGSAVKNAYDLDQEDPKVRESYGDHIGGQSMLLARRLTEAGVPVVQVCCGASALNPSAGDMWDTHGDNFNRLKQRLLPPFDRGMSALIADLANRGTLDDTLVVQLSDFGRTPRIDKKAGRNHYPSVYSVALAGGGIRGGQVYGSSDANGAFPAEHPCSPADIHATIFHSMGISPQAQLHDMLGRPMPICDGNVLPLL